MTRGIGIDIVDVARMEKRIAKSEFLNLVFTDVEITFCKDKKHSAQHFSARFAAKEAYMKATGLGWTSDTNFKEIEISNNADGKPKITLSGQSLAYYKANKFKQVLVSLSHTETTATAMVVLD